MVQNHSKPTFVQQEHTCVNFSFIFCVTLTVSKLFSLYKINLEFYIVKKIIFG